MYLPIMSILALSVMGIFAPIVKADEWDKKTNITIARLTLSEDRAGDNVECSE
jgi:hypothetical protein